MSGPGTHSHDVVIVRGNQADVIGRGFPATVRLLADSSATGGLLSTVRVTLAEGADGARPHHHASSSELFYVLGGAVEILSGDQVVTAHEGDLIIVPPKQAHAFAAAPGQPADLLVIIAPGVERFGYFRQLEQIGKGELPAESLLAVQDLYDTFFLDSAAWRDARSSTSR